MPFLRITSSRHFLHRAQIWGCGICLWLASLFAWPFLHLVLSMPQGFFQVAFAKLCVQMVDSVMKGIGNNPFSNPATPAACLPEQTQTVIGSGIAENPLRISTPACCLFDSTVAKQ